MTPEEITLIEARRATAREWFSNEPRTDQEIAEYYRSSKALPAELRAWHETPARASWTRAIVSWAKKLGRKSVLDIGCGWGYELEALMGAGFEVCGVEPNDEMRAVTSMTGTGIPCFQFLAEAPVEKVDMILCLDVLEHLNDPESMLSEITDRTDKGVVLVEHTPTWDLSDPLHPTSNADWLIKDHIGPGWKLLLEEASIGVWQRI